MSDTTPQGICVFCGTARPVNVAICPTCKRTWIDRRLTETPPSPAPPAPTPPPQAPDEPEPIDVVSLDELNARIAQAGPDLPDETPPEPEPDETPPEPEPIDIVSLDELNDRIAQGGTAPPLPPPPKTLTPTGPVPPPPPPPAPPSEPELAEPLVADADTDGGEPPLVPAGRDRRGWWVALAVAAAVLSLYLIVFVILLNDGNGEPVVIDSTTTTSTVATATTTTTEATTTTTTSTTTTTTTIPPIEAVGNPITLGDLKLGAFALGPLDLATDSTDALGRLVATFGQPEARDDAGEADGLCPGTTGLTYRWGGLTAIFLDVDGGEALVGYRLTPSPDGAEAATDNLATLSGLQLGQAVGDIRAIYANSGVAVIDRAGIPTFVLQRSSDNRTLLWGPVTSSDDAGVIEGIFSPLWCDDGPTPS